MIELIFPSRSGKEKKRAHPEWEAWMDACAYTHEEARKELGLANGTFYRRIQHPPDRLTRLAMAAAWDGLETYPECHQ